MIKLPDPEKAWEFENSFYLTCDKTRLSKVMAHHELYRSIVNKGLVGEVVECGVFKGVSLVRFAMFRDLLETTYSRSIIGFDTFGRFPETAYQDDVKLRENFIIAAGEQSISEEQLRQVLERKGLNQNIELIVGDIRQTVPEYVRNNSALKIALLNLDTDIYEPAVAILEQFWSRIVPGGILILDDYSKFPGETKAVDDFFKGQDVKIRKFNYAMTPCYVVK